MDLDDAPLIVDDDFVSGESQLVFTEMGEFVTGVHFDKLYERKPSVDVPKNRSVYEEEPFVKEEKSVATVDKTIREVPIGKGLSEALKEEDIELAGRNNDKRESKLVGLRSDEKGEKEINIDRTDEYGRKLTPKGVFSVIFTSISWEEAWKEETGKTYAATPGGTEDEKCRPN
ncbi:hypothetical protein CQW23_20141 [Capsicum baccatum]|uniref:Uncharacterized protein n=1 Tax=Capsicum baccatum TaxID=33114 RepID=A0A2G2W7V4_CAPBA|nr:hypothetical protein CQW23_20141 [Capsicum baccatum]